ncbi:hypothetical protein SAMN02745824_2018 [Parasphingorhabdus marina DSM 22363]|uniref:Membrane domain of glycerophosphoryl diester phosphodiesterase n=1 Tax=Parasphingorhabdus marina DSM 22363 TaxID=1123272 RepID=A0A1N6ENY5_9SPHN|nr:glycerophosphoryl diester phosphodiesterase membrane domain-containing protein [Parasphingorhabdus marina]SIN84708.1 hypothetical protein SAMN02745824_2018 [Parasphingorhabdus marina DSM 22363]
MQKFDMAKAWTININMVKDHGIVVGLILFATYLIMALLFFSLFGGVSTSLFNPTEADPEAMAAMMAGRFGFLGLVSLGVFLLSIAGYFISWRVVLSGKDETIGGAFVYGLVASMPAFIAIIVLYIAFTIVFGIVFAIFGVALFGAVGADSNSAGAGAVGLMVLLYIGLLGTMLFLFARLGTTGPIMAANRSYNPFGAMMESWKITKNNSLMLMLYLFLISVAFFVVYMIIALVAGLLINLSVAIGIILGVVAIVPLMIFYLLVPAAIYSSLLDTNLDVENVFS